MKILNKKENIALAVLLLVSFFMWFYSVDGNLFGYDQARFYLNAVSIKEGTGYNNIWLPEITPERINPPLYPAFLAFLLIISDSVFLLKLAQFVIHALSAMIILQLAQRFYKNRKLALLAFAVFILNPFSLYYASYLINEGLFILLILASFFLFYGVKEDRYQKYLPACIGVTAALATLTRTQGIFLFIAFFLSYLY